MWHVLAGVVLWGWPTLWLLRWPGMGLTWAPGRAPEPWPAAQPRPHRLCSAPGRPGLWDSSQGRGGSGGPWPLCCWLICVTLRENTPERPVSVGPAPCHLREQCRVHFVLTDVDAEAAHSGLQQLGTDHPGMGQGRCTGRMRRLGLGIVQISRGLWPARKTWVGLWSTSGPTEWTPDPGQWA